MTLSPRSHPRRWSAMAVLVATMWAPWTAQAALFGDDEARRAILQLREQRTQDLEAQRGQMEALTRQVEQLQRSVLELNTQIEQLKVDVVRKRCCSVSCPRFSAGRWTSRARSTSASAAWSHKA